MYHQQSAPKKHLRKTALLWIVLFLSQGVWAQQLTLEQCREKALNASPSALQRSLVEQASALTREITGAAYLPKIQLNAQATYQNEVTKVNLTVPGVTIPSPSKDQYRAVVDVSQTLYDGGATKAQTNVQMAQYRMQTLQTEVALDQLEDRVNQLYFAVLFVDAQRSLTELGIQELDRKVEQMEGMLRNGVGNPTAVDVLRAERLKLRQKLVELAVSRETALASLGILMGTELAPQTKLEIPETVQNLPGGDPIRPELLVLSEQRALAEQQAHLLGTKNIPKLQAFVQAGYGNPGLNMFKEGFQPIAMGGVRLNWTIWDFKTSSKERRVAHLNAEMADQQAENTRRAVRIQQLQYRQEIGKYRTLIELDREAVALRTRVKETVSAQLQQGVATANDYLTELNNELQARENLRIHELQRLQAEENYRHLMGKPLQSVQR